MVKKNKYIILCIVLIILILGNEVVYSKIIFKDNEILDIILFENFEYEKLRDEFLKYVGIDDDFVKIFNKDDEEITSENYKILLDSIENLVYYQYKDVFGKKISKKRNLYILNEKLFLENLGIDRQKYEIKNVSVDIVYKDSLTNKILVGKIFTEPIMKEKKSSYMIKINHRNHILWGKMFEDSKVNKFNKLIETKDGEYCLIGSAYRDSDWTDGFIIKIDDTGKVCWNKFYGSSHIDDFKDIISIDGDNFLVLAEVTNSDGDVGVPITITNPLNKDLVLLRYDRDGNIVWQNSIGDENEINAIKILNEEDDIIVVGEILSELDSSIKNFVISGFDLDGKFKFSTTFRDFEDVSIEFEE